LVFESISKWLQFYQRNFACVIMLACSRLNKIGDVFYLNVEVVDVLS